LLAAAKYVAMGLAAPEECPQRNTEQLYRLFCWHKDVKIADAGNIKSGATLNDTYAALKTVIKELADYGRLL